MSALDSSDMSLIYSSRYLSQPQTRISGPRFFRVYLVGGDDL